METPDEIMGGFPKQWERYELWKNLEKLRVIFKRNGEFVVCGCNGFLFNEICLFARWLVNSARLAEGSFMRVFFSELEEMEDLTEDE